MKSKQLLLSVQSNIFHHKFYVFEIQKKSICETLYFTNTVLKIIKISKKYRFH